MDASGGSVSAGVESERRAVLGWVLLMPLGWWLYEGLVERLKVIVVSDCSNCPRVCLVSELFMGRQRCGWW